MIALFEQLLYGLPESLIGFFVDLWRLLGFRPVVLGSDLLIYVLLLAGSMWFYFAMRREYWRVAVRQVAANWVAMLSFGILVLYGSVAFLDTLHFRKAVWPEVAAISGDGAKAGKEVPLAPGVFALHVLAERAETDAASGAEEVRWVPGELPEDVAVHLEGDAAGRLLPPEGRYDGGNLRFAAGTGDTRVLFTVLPRDLKEGEDIDEEERAKSTPPLKLKFRTSQALPEAKDLRVRVAIEQSAFGQIQSVLDRVCAPLTETEQGRPKTERTYSAPLAARSFAKEDVFAEDGTRTREFKRLEYGGAHLTDPDQKGGDILKRVMGGLGLGLGFGLLCLLVGFVWLARQPEVGEERRASRFRWMIGTILFLAAVCFGLGTVYFLGSGYHLFGTDKSGQDVFYIALKGARTGLVIGTLTTLIVTPFAIAAGILSGYFGGWVDDAIVYVYTTLSSIPDILLIAAAMLILQVGMKEEEAIITADKRLVYLCIILGITSWTGLCRLIRAETLKLRELEYVQAADAFGISKLVIMLRHLMPNVLHIVLISVVLRFSGLVLAEAVLAYIGIGVDPSMQSWGNMINMARLELARDPAVWWSLMAAFLRRARRRN